MINSKIIFSKQALITRVCQMMKSVLLSNFSFKFLLGLGVDSLP
jgi:hypothetical protein